MSKEHKELKSSSKTTSKVEKSVPVEAKKPITNGAASIVSSSTNGNGKRPRSARLDEAQSLKAAQALLTHHAKFKADQAKNKKREDLLAADWDYIFAQIALTKIPERASPKPVPIALPHPIYAPEDDFAVCVIVKEEDKGKVKRALDTLKLEGVSEVVGLQELRTDYKQYQERRKLRDAFDMFLVDDRILPMLGRALGKIFFSKKKQPIPLKIGQMLGKGDPSTVAKRIIAAREKTYLYRNHGNCVTIRIAKTNFKPSQVVENLMQGTETAVEALPGKWKNVINISIKTAESVALPVYTRLPSYLLKKPKALSGAMTDEELAALIAAEQAGDAAEGDEMEEEEREEKLVVGKKGAVEEGIKQLKKVKTQQGLDGDKPAEGGEGAKKKRPREEEGEEKEAVVEEKKKVRKGEGGRKKKKKPGLEGGAAAAAAGAGGGEGAQKKGKRPREEEEDGEEGVAEAKQVSKGEGGEKKKKKKVMMKAKAVVLEKEKTGLAGKKADGAVGGGGEKKKKKLRKE